MTEPARLYLATPSAIDDSDGFAAALKVALEAGDVACLLIRGGAGEADRLREIAHAHDVAAVIEDRVELVAPHGLDGVHVTTPEPDLAAIRETIGADAIIGVEVGLSRHAAFLAAEAGADYVAFGPEAELEILDFWRLAMTTPSVAMTPASLDEAAARAAAGADFVALSGPVWEAEDGPAAAVRALEERLRR